MRKLLFGATVAGVLAVGTGAAVAAEGDKFGIGLNTSLMGLGLEGRYAYSDKLSIRGNVNYRRFEMPTLLKLATQIAGIPYDYDFRFLTTGILGDYHFVGSSTSGNSLMLTGGVYYNANRFSLTYTPFFAGTTRIGATDYDNLTAVGTLTDEFTFRNSFAPYIGVGAETNFFSNLPVSGYARFGVLLQGPLDATMTSTGSVTLADLALEEAETEAKLGFLTVLPSFAVGVTYRF